MRLTNLWKRKNILRNLIKHLIDIDPQLSRTFHKPHLEAISQLLPLIPMSFTKLPKIDLILNQVSLIPNQHLYPMISLVIPTSGHNLLDSLERGSVCFFIDKNHSMSVFEVELENSSEASKN